jgi:5-methyltetrahydrofolate--homocysteine methyltransferase
MTDHLRSLAAMSTRFVSVYPNAGLPDERGQYAETPTSLAFKMTRFLDEGWVNVIGGCCGTTPAHIRALRDLAGGRPPRVPPAREVQAVSGVEVFYPADDNRPLFVGERTNVIGSRRFKELVVAEQFEEAAEVGRAQVKNGAQVLDVCLANPDRDENGDMDRFMTQITRKVKVPLMIDSTDAGVIEAALRHCQGKSIVNSINLEDGEERFERVVPLLRTYGGAVVVGCIDEDKVQGMAVTRARKLGIAERCHALLTGKYGLPSRDLIFDALVFPVGTGDANYVGSAVETIEGIRAIKARFPECKTILGISNVSFGLPPAGREVLNSVFLYHCTKAGLDYAIVNTERLERYPSIPEEERRLAEDLIYGRGSDPVAAFAAYFRDKRKAPPAASTLSLDERLARYIVEGSRDGPHRRSEREAARGRAARDRQRPADARHGRGRSSVQRQPADRRRGTPVGRGDEDRRRAPRAVHGKGRGGDPRHDRAGDGEGRRPRHRQESGRDHPLEQRLPRDQPRHQGAARGSDRGLSHAQARRIRALWAFGEVRATDGGHGAGPARRGHRDPALRGRRRPHQALHATRIAAEYGGLTLYAKDAMEGLDLANQLFSAPTRDALVARLKREQAALVESAAAAPVSAAPAATATPTRRLERATVPAPPDLERHVLRDVPLTHIYPYLNLQMLYGKHLGVRGLVERLLAAGDPKAGRGPRDRRGSQARGGRPRSPGGARRVSLVPRPRGGDAIILFDPSGRETARFDFRASAMASGCVWPTTCATTTQPTTSRCSRSRAASACASWRQA